MCAANHGNLKVYQASAGSGKTFRLAVEYIRLLILRPDNYKHILAVTFTNKATSEMKDRILSQLYGIWKGMPASDAYLQAILDMPGMQGKTKPWARERAGEALGLLLADYGHFRVETIDAYFQSVLREVSRELALPNDFRIELNTDWPIEEAVTSLFDQITTDQRLLRALMHIVEERIDNTEDWNVRGALAEFGKHLFSEQYLAYPLEKRKNIGDMERVSLLKAMLRQWEEDLRQQLRDVGEGFAECLGRLDINDDLTHAAPDTATWMRRLAEGELHEDICQTIRDRAVDTEKWLTAKTKGPLRAYLSGLIDEQLRPLLAQAIETEERIAPLLSTIKAIGRHIDTLAFVNAINDNVRRLNERAHRFLLADTAHFLHELIDGSDIPFLYERAGVDFKHIMIDEFQDTSRLQWENFEPLVKNSLDAGNECLIVGDVKQSIYRWRNSDWGILNALDQQAAYRNRIEHIVQRSNFRSSGRVVRFNNDFFASANRMLCQEFDIQIAGTSGESKDIELAYSQVEQEPQEKQRDRGYVKVTVISAKKKGDNDGDEEDNEAAQVQLVGDTVRQLLELRFEMSDIAILTRKNKQITTIMRHLLARKDMPRPIELTCAEAFQLDASPAVLTLVQAMRVLDNPTDRTQLVALALLHHAGEKKSEDIFLTMDEDKLWEWLPREFARQRGELPLMSLYELAEWLIRQFQLDQREGQAPYLFAFLDRLSAFLKTSDSDLRTFLAQWDMTLHAAKVATDNDKGIKLMTIHKAKGLEFQTVIVPFCDWDMQGMPDSIIWGETELLASHREGLDSVPLMPLPFTKETQQSLFHQEFVDETMRYFVDNLNLLYVAFTRAVDNLFILCNDPKEPSKSNPHPALTASRLIKDFVMARQSIQAGTYECGWLTLPAQQQAKTEDNPLLFPAPAQPLAFHTHEPALRFRQSKQGAQFLKQDDEDDTPDEPGYLNEGNIFHALLARLRTADDADRVLAEAEAEGMFDSEDTAHKMRRLLASCLDDGQARQWFDPHWHVVNERSIIERDGEGRAITHRPDRVVTDDERTLVIDYKTGQPHPKHHEQVRNYMRLLTQMGYTGVEGYLWYVRGTNGNRIIRV